jgi:hypothetical protein
MQLIAVIHSHRGYLWVYRSEDQTQKPSVNVVPFTEMAENKKLFVFQQIFRNVYISFHPILIYLVLDTNGYFCQQSSLPAPNTIGLQLEIIEPFMQ